MRPLRLITLHVLISRKCIYLRWNPLQALFTFSTISFSASDSAVRLLGVRRFSPSSSVVHLSREDGSLDFILLPEVVAFFLLTSFLFEILWRLQCKSFYSGFILQTNDNIYTQDYRYRLKSAVASLFFFSDLNI